MKRTSLLDTATLALLTAIGLGVAFAADPPQQAAKPAPAAVVGGGQFSPYAGQTIPNRVYWGVAHVHTTFSFDAGLFGTTLTPDDLFRVATGGEVVMDNGVRFKQDRPLDWVAITDHAEYMGISDRTRQVADPALLAIPQGKRGTQEHVQVEVVEEAAWVGIEVVVIKKKKPVFDASKITGGAWAHATEAAEKWDAARRLHLRCTASYGPPCRAAAGLDCTRDFRRDGAERVNQVGPFLALPEPGYWLSSGEYVAGLTRAARCLLSRTTAT